VPNIRWLLSLITAVHRAVYRATGGRLGSSLVGAKMLLLTTRGRRSGREREVPLLTLEHALGWIVVGSNAGDDRDPAWWLNLQSDPEARIQVGSEQHAVRGRLATREEAAEIWPLLLEAHANYASYRTRTDRDIPIVVLEPQS
jgi:deazaflavin-dependent oxidoreductase (nitroreductase family)